jgi:hypothetical protein
MAPRCLVYGEIIMVDKQETREGPSDHLRTWRALHEVINTLNEEECFNLLEDEKKFGRRRLFLQRIYGRWSKLRDRREAKELQAMAVDQ